ncbi:MAG: hypothetical protein RMJ98_21505, partial [Myxococcales bacterium]|nr:hypothetical protein [Polyangiaceae bacterium]MDW8251882.1 hypothetical protein [Myxococcales bacterium]
MNSVFSRSLTLSLTTLMGIFEVVGCGGGQTAAPHTSGDGYSEYTCPEPIGKIVREDCSKSQLKYEGRSFEGSV